MELLHVDTPGVAREVTAGQRNTALLFIIAGVCAIRGVVAAITPLAYDEAYYWLWSKHLAAGYADHPPAIAFAIAGGTALFGDTSFGVRAIPFLLSLIATVAVWRAGALILAREQAGPLAALFFTLMPMVGIEALVATPDALVIAAAAPLLFVLAKIATSGDGRWWIFAGIAAGFALLSKLTGFFLGLGILGWLVVSPRGRRWLFSIWPYLGGAIALAMFLPVLVWNAEHDWLSFTRQFGRVGEGGFTLRYIGEFIGAQLGLASPAIAILASIAVFRLSSSRAALQSPAAIVVGMITPAMLYFLWHALRDRVQGNWPSFLYPAIALAAASVFLSPSRGWFLRATRAVAAPLATVMLAIVYAQAVWGFIPIVRDPVSRLLGVGMDRVAMDLEILAEQNGTKAFIATGYAPAAWLAFYLPSHAPVVQVNERFRYVNEPPPPASLFEAPLLYVTELRNDQSELLKQRFSEVRRLALIGRYRSGAELDEYAVYRVSGLTGDPFF